MNRTNNSWARDLRKASLISARTLPMPETKSEDWRCLNPRHLFPQNTLNLTSEEITCTQFVSWINETNKLEEESWQNTNEVQVLPIWQAFDNFPQLAKKYFQKDQHQKDLSCALIGTLSTGGAYIHLANEANLEHPLHVCHRVNNNLEDKDNFFALHTFVQAQANSRGTVIESFTDESQDLLVHSLLEIDLEDGAQLTYIVLSDWSENTKNLAHIYVNLGENASLKLIFVGLGGSLTKVF
ncbi:SufD family Fe-S cluster assembly protein, partial [bacterium]|nr:SufD family Fe-S cluster assembly protein [bacterium]